MPEASSPAVAARMSAQPRRDTAPEMAIRKALHSRGLRYRVQYRPSCLSRRTVDIAFTGRRVAVFVDGCFWHGCPVHHRPPRSNTAWWESKILGNRSRDADTDRLLSDDGWTVVRAWEHEDPVAVADRIESLLRPRSS